MTKAKGLAAGSVLVLLLAPPAEPASEPTDPPSSGSGTICVAPLPKNARAIDHDRRGSEPPREYTYRFSVAVDARARVDVPKDAPVRIDGLATDRRHLLEIRDGDRTIESFWFTFDSTHTDGLCLSYTPWYQKWRLDPPKPAAWWCDCSQDGKRPAGSAKERQP